MGHFPSYYYKEAIRTQKGTVGKGKMMYSTIPTAGMAREEWLQLRKTGIGGSEAGAVCGLNPYAGPMSVYRDKTSDVVEDRDNEAMRQGRDLEDYVARRFAEETGLKVRRSRKMYRSGMGQRHVTRCCPSISL